MDISLFAFCILTSSIIATCGGQLDMSSLMEGMMGGGGGGGMGGMMGGGGGGAMARMMGGGGPMGGMGGMGGMGAATGGLAGMSGGEMSEMLSNMGAAGFGGMGAAGLVGMGAAGLGGMGAAGLGSMESAGIAGLDANMLKAMAAGGIGAIGAPQGMMGAMGAPQGMMGAMGASGSSATMQMVTAETMANFKMTEIVKAVLGPHAHPDDEMIKYAIAQKNWPTTIEEMVPYMNLMLELSKTIGIYMPDGTVKKPNVITTSNRLALILGKPVKRNGTNNDSSQPSLEEVRTLIIQRGILWFRSQKPPKSGPAAGATG